MNKLKNLLITLALLLTFSHSLPAAEKPRVLLETSMGEIEIELHQQLSPQSVENFLKYVNDGFYNGTIFHRVIPGFMVQGGGFTSAMKKKPVRGPIQNEADNRLKNERGTVAMARTSNPHSATAQFFINSVYNDFLDHRDRSTQGWGYTVFGRVIRGMEVVDAISDLATTTINGMKNVPEKTVMIKSAKQI